MGKFLLLLTFLSIFGVSLAGDTALPVAGGYDLIEQDHLPNKAPVVHGLFSLLSSKNPEFPYILKSIVSGKVQIVQGSHTVLKIEAGLKDNPNETKKCELDYIKNLNDAFSHILLECEGDSKFYMWDKE